MTWLLVSPVSLASMSFSESVGYLQFNKGTKQISKDSTENVEADKFESM